MGGAGERPQPEQAERQQRDLDHARDYHSGRCRTAGGDAWVGRRVVHSVKVSATCQRTRRSCSSATLSEASAGERWRPCCRRCASASRPDFVVVNGENAAGGVGITPKVAEQLFGLGVDAITLGNHTYRHREVYEYLDAEPRIVRPANFLRSQPGHGWCVVSRGDTRLGVLSLSGNLFMNAGRHAFSEADAALHALRGEADHVLVDMHAEATSEKVGMGWHLDGRVTAVVGTHTHIPTADARVLPGGTAYITDVGMTGPRGGVIGVKREQALEALSRACRSSSRPPTTIRG